MEDFDFYISSKGRLIIPEYDINYLINLRESNIPSMPEANEISARIAGRDGDVVLSTTYEPISFNIVCYTEDNLTMEEKVKEEKKINRFLDSIKNNTKTFAIEKDEKFYNVKYNGLATAINYPKHLEFSIPLKSSDSYSKNIYKNHLVGENIFESDTIKEVGAIITIKGPAVKPRLSLNDYIMFYDYDVIEGTSLVIDTSKATATLIDRIGNKSNVMKYYNHNFPRIQSGKNFFKVLAGIDNQDLVTIDWYDLDL